MNTYFFLHILHLLAAFVFIGTVTFEVLFFEPVYQRLPAELRQVLSRQLGPRVRNVVPKAVVVLYLAGLGLAWQHRAALAHPTGSAFALLFSLKLLLAASVLIHVITALTLIRRKRLTSRLQQRIHRSVFCHMIGIVLLAKAMFYVTW